MKGLKVFVDNLANRINQPHFLEVELKKVFRAGIKYSQERGDWNDAKIITPDLVENQDYSENVLAVVEGFKDVQVMCYCYNFSEDDKERGYFWANCYGKIDGEAEFDDNYTVTYWRSIPKFPSF